MKKKLIITFGLILSFVLGFYFFTKSSNKETFSRNQMSKPSHFSNSKKESISINRESLEVCQRDFKIAGLPLSIKCYQEISAKLSLERAEVEKLIHTCQNIDSIEKLKSLAKKISFKMNGELNNDLVNKRLCQETLESKFETILKFYAENLSEIESYATQIFFVIFDMGQQRLEKMKVDSFQGQLQANLLESILSQSSGFILDTCHLLIRMLVIAQHGIGPTPFDSLDTILNRYPEFQLMQKKYKTIEQSGRLVQLMNKID